MDTYANYISQFKVYPTMKEARAKGYEAHHIVPRAMQEIPDDRCVRLTAFQHIYAHYLLALESEEGAGVFYGMYNFNSKKLTSLEQITLENLEDWARVREEGRQHDSESNSGEKNGMYGRQHTEESRVKMSEKAEGRTGLKGEKSPWYGKVGPMYGKHHTDEARQKMSESRKGKSTWNKGRTDCYSVDTKRKMSEKAKLRSGKKNSFYGQHHTEESRQKISESKKGKTAWNKGKPGIKGKKWWNNGQICKQSIDCPGPDFVPGRLTKTA